MKLRADDFLLKFM